MTGIGILVFQINNILLYLSYKKRFFIMRMNLFDSLSILVHSVFTQILWIRCKEVK